MLMLCFAYETRISNSCASNGCDHHQHPTKVQSMSIQAKRHRHFDLVLHFSVSSYCNYLMHSYFTRTFKSNIDDGWCPLQDEEKIFPFIACDNIDEGEGSSLTDHDCLEDGISMFLLSVSNELHYREDHQDEPMVTVQNKNRKIANTHVVNVVTLLDVQSRKSSDPY